MMHNEPTKSVVSISEMARMVGLSRQRFHQLRGSTFPEPLRDSETGRPYYTEELQKICLEVRRRNCGINGKPILFYAPRNSFTTPAPKRRKKVAKPKPVKHYTGIADAVRSLGLTAIKDGQVAAAVEKLFPSGTNGTPEGEVIRTVFVHIQRKNMADKQGE